MEQVPRERRLALVERVPDRQQIARGVWRIVGVALATVAVIATVLAILYVLSSYFLIPFLDLLKITAVPLTIGGAVPLLNWLQKRRELDLENKRTQDAALLAYIDKISELLIDKNLHDKSNEYDQMRITARARTLAVLRQLDGERKRTVLLFLREARLINKEKFVDHQSNVIYHPHYVGLDGADLRGADLGGARLISTNREEPVYLQGAVLADANLKGAILEKADLAEAILKNADLEGADLRNADLRAAVLEGASLMDTDLSYADLSRATGIAEEELDKYARSLAGATMPNGQKYEDWLKNRERHAITEGSEHL